MTHLAFLAAALSAGIVNDPNPLRIRIYNVARMDQSTVNAASAQFGRILRLAGIRAEISRGDIGVPEASLIVYNAGPADERETLCLRRRDIALGIVAPPGRGSPHILGQALPFSPEGLNVLIYAENVLDAASRKGRPTQNVLAAAMAHETGHILLNSPGHARSGLMAEVWLDNEYGHLSQDHLLMFSRQEARRMQARLALGRCERETGAARGKLGCASVPNSGGDHAPGSRTCSDRPSSGLARNNR